MAVRVVVGDLFEARTQTLVNAVNCAGVMGKGIALAFRQRFPAKYEDYAGRCVAHTIQLGQPYLWKSAEMPWVLNFPTKDHWRSASRLPNIVAGLEYLEQHYQELGITSLATPALGCGLGQLKWRVVGPVLYQHLSRLNIPVELYATPGTPDNELQIAFLAGDAASG